MLESGRAATEEVTTAEGFLSAGDVATLDEDRFVYIVDRIKDIIISGGANISPREIEEVLARHPDVTDVAVVGVRDTNWGERVVAVVVGGAADDELERLARKHLASYKVPRTFRHVEELPRNSAGKVLKRKLRENLS